MMGLGLHGGGAVPVFWGLCGGGGFLKKKKDSKQWESWERVEHQEGGGESPSNNSRLQCQTLLKNRTTESEASRAPEPGS